MNARILSEADLRPEPHAAGRMLPASTASADAASDRLAGARAGALAAAAALLLLSIAMTAAAMAGLAPHPPAARLPFVSANAALALLALTLLWQRRSQGAGWAALLTALSYIPSVGPQKFITEAEAVLLAPVIVVGTGCVVMLAVCGWRLRSVR